MTQAVDASVVVSFLLDNDALGQWCEREIAADDLVAPQLMPFETANIIRRSASRGVVDEVTARQALEDLRHLEVVLVGFEPLAERTWELRSNLTVYDASYVATAELIAGRLITLDERIANAPTIACTVSTPPGRDGHTDL